MSIPADSSGYEVRISPAQVGRRTWLVVTLSGLVLGALVLRLQAVWQRITEAPDELGLRLVGDEIGYDEVADALLHGSFFQSPVRVPVYPMFIAAAYHALGERSPAQLLPIQAFVGVAAVPLTYLLARRLTGVIPALVAAGIVAFDDPLIEHARQIYAEIVYTPLLLGALLAIILVMAGREGFDLCKRCRGGITAGRAPPLRSDLGPADESAKRHMHLQHWGAIRPYKQAYHLFPCASGTHLGFPTNGLRLRNAAVSPP